MNQPVKESRKEQRDRRPGPRGGVTPRRAVDSANAGRTRQGGGGEEVSPLCNVIRKTTSKRKQRTSH